MAQRAQLPSALTAGVVSGAESGRKTRKGKKRRKGREEEEREEEEDDMEKEEEEKKRKRKKGEKEEEKRRRRRGEEKEERKRRRRKRRRGRRGRGRVPAIETPAAARAGHSSQAVARGAEAFPPDLFAGLTESGAALCEGGVTAAAQFVPYLSALAEAPGRLRAALESNEACALRRVVCAGRLLLQRLEADPELAAALRASRRAAARAAASRL